MLVTIRDKVTFNKLICTRIILNRCIHCKIALLQLNSTTIFVITNGLVGVDTFGLYLPV